MVTPLPHSFHEGSVTRFQLGPRRELILYVSIALLPPGRMQGTMERYDFRIRFGGITNFEEVSAFFQPYSWGLGIGSLVYAPNEVSRVNRLVFRLQTMPYGYPELIIRCRNIAIWQDTQEGSLMPAPTDVPKELLARIVASREGWMGWLCPLVDEGMLGEIAEADYGYLAAGHLRGLRRIRDGRVVPRVLTELPLEVLELVRYSEPDDPTWQPGGQGERGHLMRLFCCAVLLTAAGEPALDGYIEDEPTLRRLVPSAVALGTEALDALLPLLVWRASLPPTDEADRAFLAVSLVLLVAARYRRDGDGALLHELGEWAIGWEARARAAVTVPTLTTDVWLLGLKGSADGDDQWRAVAWELLVEPRVPHPAEAAAVLNELGARIVGG